MKWLYIGLGLAIALTLTVFNLAAGQSAGCDRAYPDFCIPPAPPDLNCKDVRPNKNFRVFPPDPHGFDRDRDGVGCEG